MKILTVEFKLILDGPINTFCEVAVDSCLEKLGLKIIVIQLL